MLTTDAASFGQTGLSGIKVVEINGHHVQPYVNVFIFKIFLVIEARGLLEPLKFLKNLTLLV
jgi:hypothetical protein